MSLLRILPAFAALVAAATGYAAPGVSQRPADFPLASDRTAAPFVIEIGTDRAVARAADDVRADVERVTGTLPDLQHEISTAGPRTVVIAGVVNQSPLLNRLAASGKLDLSRLAGAWESFLVTVVPEPFPGIDQALVIAGSDRRGAIYGLYEISVQIGVSPWQWWADVRPPKKSILTIPAATHRFGPPSVKYRGIFINDEDWGLQPWAAKTFEPAAGGIGPKTYAKVFELLLRLRANTLWPAMHACTKPFNAFPENKQLADDYGIVMGSSHAEPMLRNNVGEWPHERATDYNYVTNREGVLRYWEQRVAENGRFENIYTLGMRGIHDSSMMGPKTDPERIRLLEQIFADQQALLARHVRPEVERVPQIFCAYKEVLALYRQGLRVPDDVTIVWPDDNFGYVRDFATPAERTRPGGFGIYYHLSYLGRPLSYLWLCTTPPALVWEEMHKSYEQGADRVWIANVGDLKPAEISMDFFLQMAWDIDRWRPENLPEYLGTWARNTFGPAHADEIARVLAEYYVLNYQRKPEHLQWWLPGQPQRPSEFTDAEVQTRLDAFARLRRSVDALKAQMPARLSDAFYELIYYPVTGSALANERFFLGERGDPRAAEADARLHAETSFFNEQLAGGKWRGLLSLEPADQSWASMRIAPWSLPAHARSSIPSPSSGTFIALPAAGFETNAAGDVAKWTVIPGLGRTGNAVTPLPTNTAPIPLAAVRSAPRLDYALTFPASGEFQLALHLLPTHAITGTALRVGLALDDAAPEIVSLEIDDGGTAWARGVLDAVRIATTKLAVTKAGRHTLHLYAIDPGIVLDKLVVDLGGLTPTYLGPASDGGGTRKRSE